MKVLVTGVNGQLGHCIRHAAKEYNTLATVFTTSNDLDITRQAEVNAIFEQHNFTHCINVAAYTDVELAESEKEKAFAVNADGTKNLAEACKTHHVTLIHLSTDYVFDGSKHTDYVESDPTNPINTYGASKLKGEEFIQEILSTYFIVRTSWLYSQFGDNFYKTILNKAKEGATLNITTAQRGTPTNANDLAVFLLELIAQNETSYGIYHFSNLGEATWFDFAKAILEDSALNDTTELIPSNEYKTKARRPANSVMSKEKTLKIYPGIQHWKKSLCEMIKRA